MLRRSEINKEMDRPLLINMIDRNHPLCKLSRTIHWDSLEDAFKDLYTLTDGRPGTPIRLMVSLHYLKYTYDLSDEQVVYHWLENPYWQYFSGMVHFETTLPVHPSSMTKFRKRLKKADKETLLKETIDAGLKLKVISKRSFHHVNVDTTVQEKDIAYPTDAKLYHRMREKLVQEAKQLEIPLRQSYKRKGKESLFLQARYAHSRKMKKARQEVKHLKNYLGRTIRDIKRKMNKLSFSADQAEKMKELLVLADRLYRQERTDKNKLYSLHEPNVCCISKGKSHKKYEFGNKASYVTTSKEGFVIGALSFTGNPYDGHTLSAALEQAIELSGYVPDYCMADKGYKGHKYEGDTQVFLQGQHRKKGAPVKKWFRRRSAIEATIGHMKMDGRLDRNRLKGTDGDETNAIFAGCGQNLRKMLRFLLFLPLRIFHILREFIMKELWKNTCFHLQSPFAV